MRCPKCDTELVDGGYREFETLSDHVGNPNALSHPPRSTLVCPNKCFGDRQFFDIYGDFYGGNFGEYAAYGNARE